MPMSIKVKIFLLVLAFIPAAVVGHFRHLDNLEIIEATFGVLQIFVWFFDAVNTPDSDSDLDLNTDTTIIDHDHSEDV
jgi:hypothetical protein